MWVSGILTAVGIILIVAKLNPVWLERMLGYDFVIDLLMSFGIVFIFGSTGTISGTMASIVTGISISIILWIAKNSMAYQKLEKVDGKWIWKRFHGKWTLAYIGEKLHQKMNGSTNVVEQFMTGWNNVESVKKVS
jgi:hypothetical protein